MSNKIIMIVVTKFRKVRSQLLKYECFQVYLVFLAQKIECQRGEDKAFKDLILTFVKHALFIFTVFA